MLHSRIVHETLKEVKRCTQSGIKINTFMLGADFTGRVLSTSSPASTPAGFFTPRRTRWATTSWSTISPTNANASGAPNLPPHFEFLSAAAAFEKGGKPGESFSDNQIVPPK